MHKRLNILAPFVAIAVISGCGESGSSIKDPEADHCERAAGQLTRDVTGGLGTVGVIETKAWTTDNVRSVRVRFRYPEGNAAGLTFGAVLCTYPFEPAVQGNAKRKPQAETVYFRARNLSKNELLLLNIGLRGVKP